MAVIFKTEREVKAKGFGKQIINIYAKAIIYLVIELLPLPNACVNVFLSLRV